MQVLRFTVDKINKNMDLLPNITLGYNVYDSCGDPRLAIGSVLQILSGPGNVAPNYYCQDKGQIAGFIGDRSTISSLPIAQLLGIYGYSQISYGATDPVLNDRTLYPYYYSTGSNERVQHIAIAELVEHLGWTWVIILAVDDDHAERESKNLSNEINKHGACVDFIGTLTEVKDTDIRTLERIQKSTAEVVILCGKGLRINLFILFVETMIKDKTLVVPVTWVSHYTLLLFNGSLCFKDTIFNFDEITAFTTYVLAIKDDMLFKDIRMTEYCFTHDKEKDTLFQWVYKNSFINCSHSQLPFQTYYPSHQVYRAVYGLAHAEHNLLSANLNKEINKNIQQKKILKSQCSENCPPGYRKVSREGAPPCCYDCASCSEGEISNFTDMESCLKCEDHEWPNQEKTVCIKKQIVFLSYDGDSITLVFIIISLLLFIIAAVILGIFISFRDTPVVKANNRNLSFLLIVSIKLSFLSVFLFLGRPTDITCKLRQISFAITFSIAMSSVLAKSLMVCFAFKATSPGSPWRKLVGVKVAYFIVLVCSIFQILISVIWLATSPPFMEFDILAEPGKIIIQCNEGSVITFYIILSYLGLLASVSFIVAFLVRTLPDSFNEAKYITFSMLLFCSVWITMIPAYLSTKGKNTVCVEIFAILTSSAGLLACIFLPKCYIIVFKPEMNTKQHLLGK
ncbi:hypothetical protein XELAEV_18004965mg [Xenopus laevis]|uniref:G-protein coupled receptors family 3 profile domain-containing protein n=1 Tax=Xenopus laevis TaxID=8355 RepID=A0A974DWE5_XENLA|nr:hypothetical protein XELAEV_18004965mg [Xenopus laevis]